MPWLVEGIVARVRAPTADELSAWQTWADVHQRLALRAGAPAVVVEAQLERRHGPGQPLEVIAMGRIGPVLLNDQLAPERELERLAGELTDPAEVLSLFPGDPDRPARWDVLAAPRRYEIQPELRARLGL